MNNTQYICESATIMDTSESDPAYIIIPGECAYQALIQK